MALHHGLYGLDAKTDAISFGGIEMPVFFVYGPVEAVVRHKAELMAAGLPF